MGSKRVGGHVSRDIITKTLGFEPEVGETFVAGDLTLRVLSRTIGLEFDDEGTEQWFDRLFIVTANAVEDVEATGEALRGMFGAPEDDGEVDTDTAESEMVSAHGVDETERSDVDSAGGNGLDEAVLRDIEELLNDL